MTAGFLTTKGVRLNSVPNICLTHDCCDGVALVAEQKTYTSVCMLLLFRWGFAMFSPSLVTSLLEVSCDVGLTWTFGMLKTPIPV